MGLVLVLAVPCFAVEKETEKAPTTNIEKFMAKKGHMFVKVFYAIGKMSEQGKTKFEALVLTDPSGRTPVSMGLRVEVIEEDRFERSNAVFVDLEELDSLSKALGYMLDMSAKWGKEKTYREVAYQTNGDLSVGFYITKDNDDNKMFIKAGLIGTTIMRGDAEHLKEVKQHIDSAIALLKTK
jgi:hypothetical protein